MAEEQSRRERQAAVTQGDPVKAKQSLDEKFESENAGLSFGEKFRYVWDKSSGPTENMAMWLQSELPLPSVKITWKGIEFGDVAEFDNEEQKRLFFDAEPWERLEFLKAKREQKLAAEHPEAHAADQTGQISPGLGQVAKEMMDPTMLLPVGKTYKAMAAGGAALGAVWSTAKQLVDNEGIDLGEVGTVAATGALLAPLTGAVARKAGDLVRVHRGLPTRADIKRSDEILGAFEDEYIRQMAKLDDAVDVNAPSVRTQIGDTVADSLGLSTKEVDEALLNAQRLPLLPETPMQARTALQLHNESRVGALHNSDNGYGFIGGLIGNISQDIREHSPRLALRLQNMERKVIQEEYNYMTRAKPFTDQLKKVKRQERAALNTALSNGDFGTVRSVLRRTGGDKAVKSVDDVENMLGELYQIQKDAGIPVTFLENYYPRTVEDYPGLMASLGKEAKGAVTRARDAWAKSKGKTGSILTQEENAEFFNLYVRGLRKDPAAGVPPHVRQRSIQEVTEAMEPFYMDPADSLYLYIAQSLKTAEKYKFFGRVAKGADNKIDLEGSIGALLADESMQGLDDRALMKIKTALTARFTLGEQSPRKGLQTLRSLGYMSTLANPISAMVQLGDLGTAAFLQGHNVVPGILKAVTGKGVSVDTLGLDNIIAHEMSSVGSLSKLLNGSLSASGFRSMDRFGKNVLLNGAYQQGKRAARNPTGKAGKAFREKYREAFGDEYQGLLGDLRKGNMSENVKLFLFSELSEAQPISLSEMPLKYLEAPNGRIFYMLKSFGIKRLNLLRNNILNEWKKGNKTKATKNSLAFASTALLMGATVDELRDLIQMRDVSVEDFPDAFVNNLFKTFMVSQYTLQNATRNGVGRTVGDVLAPPLPLMDSILKDLPEIWSGEFGDNPLGSELIRDVPGVGGLIHNFFGGGLEKANERREKGWFN